MPDGYMIADKLINAQVDKCLAEFYSCKRSLEHKKARYGVYFRFPRKGDEFKAIKEAHFSFFSADEKGESISTRQMLYVDKTF